jgi:TIR domain
METIKRVFISHIHEEKEVAIALQQLIHAQLDDAALGKVECFLSSDKWQWTAGEDWLRRIKGELASADTVVLMLSPQSLARHWVNLEAGAAWITDKTIIPAPAIYSGLRMNDVPRPYSDFNAVDLEDDPYHLLRSIGDNLFYPPPLPPDHEAHRKLRETLERNQRRISSSRA